MAEASSSTFPGTSASPAPEEGGGGDGNFNSTTKSIAELAEDVQRTVMESRDSAFRYARGLQENVENVFPHRSNRVNMDFARCVKSHYHTYEDAAFNKVKVEFNNAGEDPEAAVKWSLVAGLLLLPGRVRLSKQLLTVSIIRRTTGSQIQRLAKSAYKVETRAAGLMDDLREIPIRDALKLRAEVASMVSDLKQQRLSMEKRILKISELGVAV